MDNIFWSELGKFGLGATTIGFIVIYLGKKLLEQNFNRDLAKHKSKLDMEVENFKNDLRLSSMEREHLVAKLVEKRADVIAELYRKLRNYVAAGDSFASLAEFTGEPDKDEKVELMAEKATEFRKHYLRNRIYFSEEVCTSIDNLWNESYEALLSYNVWRIQPRDQRGKAEKRKSSKQIPGYRHLG